MWEMYVVRSGLWGKCSQEWSMWEILHCCSQEWSMGEILHCCSQEWSMGEM